MNKKKIYDNVLSSLEKVIKHGQLKDKTLMELKMTASLYKYIEVVTNHYDDKNDLNFNNWTDVEGMGYGWAWMRFEEDRWHEMMSKMVSNEAAGLLRVIEDTYYLTYESERGKSYHFITIRNTFRYDTVITFSNDEILY